MPKPQDIQFITEGKEKQHILTTEKLEPAYIQDFLFERNVLRLYRDATQIPSWTRTWYIVVHGWHLKPEERTDRNQFYTSHSVYQSWVIFVRTPNPLHYGNCRMHHFWSLNITKGVKLKYLSFCFSPIF